MRFRLGPFRIVLWDKTYWGQTEDKFWAAGTQPVICGIEWGHEGNHNYRHGLGIYRGFPEACFVAERQQS